ncbi:ParB/RepB/Spo0J family partition protein [Sphingobium lignivorans]|uniref:ParB family chromosome partitioning protein n=1 Tax=Sphingobium lignivorans TaxID=2735886 RepID=A0ABR6NL35_9SPHN|nr:ParB/RepB/Spo0J family partition protein [Sphingobium lignivorans]MBB5987978.1 ParB family chromosome partitioning protein [Sphingobium lignivorans]
MSEGDVTNRAQARRPLGRGLSALLGDVTQDVPVSNDGAEGGRPENNRSVQFLPVSRIAPHPEQPRRQFDEQALDELAESIRARGVIQPIIVRPVSGGRYQIVAGERRWRAVQKAQLHEIPAIVRDFSEAETLEIALVENIQREDLNPIEEAQAYRRLIDQFQHSQDALARIVGKSRSHIANLMRLLDLPDDVQDLVMGGQLSMGHGRALIGVSDCSQLARDIAHKGLSVRETEKLVRLKREGRSPREETSNAGGARDPDLVAMEQHLSDLLGLKVGIAFENGKGSLTLNYSSLEQLDMICQKLTGGGF